MIHLYLPPSATGSDFSATLETVKRQAADQRTLCGLSLPPAVDERDEADLPKDKRCDQCAAAAVDRRRPKFVVLPG